jgi:6-phosphogluconolactonase
MTSPNQHLVFVGSYAAPSESGIYAFSLDDTTGHLTAMRSFAGVANPSFLIVHPNGRWLYAVSETNQQNDGAPGSVWALRFEHEPWSIQTLNHQPSGGDWPCHLQLDATGRWLFVSNYGMGSIGVLPILLDGVLGEMTDLIQHHGRSVHPQRQAEPHAHSTTLTPDNRFVIVADLGIDQLVIYKFDATTGKLSVHGQLHTRPGAGPRHMAFHPNGQVIYVANELDSTVTVYNYDATNGSLRELQTLDTLSSSSSENTVADIHVSSSAKRVYVSNRGHNSIAVFDVDANGQLTRMAAPSCGGNWPRNFALTPNGHFMLVANQYSSEVSVLPLLIGLDELGAPIARAAVPQASCVQFVQTTAEQQRVPQ